MYQKCSVLLDSVFLFSSIIPLQVPWRNFVYGQNFVFKYEGWNFNIGNYLFTTDTK